MAEQTKSYRTTDMNNTHKSVVYHAGSNFYLDLGQDHSMVLLEDHIFLVWMLYYQYLQKILPRLMWRSEGEISFNVPIFLKVQGKNMCSGHTIIWTDKGNVRFLLILFRIVTALRSMRSPTSFSMTSLSLGSLLLTRSIVLVCQSVQ